ncbi:hypothetical protein Tco_0210076 [Tanacetum coccineum]
MQTQESKIDTGKALDANLVDTESIRTDSTVQDDNNRSGNDTDADDCRYQTHLYDRIRANGLYDEAKKTQERIGTSKTSVMPYWLDFKSTADMEANKTKATIKI